MARPTKNQEHAKVVGEPDDIVRRVARRLQEERLKAGLSQTALAEMAGVGQHYIYGLEFGTTNPTIRTLDQITNALRIDIRDVFPGSPLAPPTKSELKRVSEMLEGLILLLKQHLSHDQELYQRESKRRSRDNSALLGEIKVLVELAQGIGKVTEAEKKSK